MANRACWIGRCTLIPSPGDASLGLFLLLEGGGIETLIPTLWALPSVCIELARLFFNRVNDLTIGFRKRVTIDFI